MEWPVGSEQIVADTWSDETRIRTDYLFALLTQVVNKAPSLVAAMILTRVFDPQIMGTFFFSTALAFLVLLFTTFGTHSHLVRAVAREPARGLDHLGDVIELRLALTTLALLVMGGGALAFAPAIAPVVVLTAIYVLIGDLYNTFGSYITGRRNFKLRLLIALAGPIALLATAALAVRAGARLEATLLCFIGASLVAVLVAGAAVWIGYGRISLALDFGRVRRLISVCWPFVVLEALQVAQFKIDTLMVFWILSSKAAAQYETAYRLLEVGRLAVRPLATIAFPGFASLLARQQWTAARDYGVKIILLAAATGCGVVLIGLIGAESIMVTVWGSAYAGTGVILRILFLSAPLVFIDLVGVMLAMALGQERWLMLLMGLATVFNVAANSIAIPQWGPEGAAWITLATEILITCGAALAIRRGVRSASRPTGTPPPGSSLFARRRP